ncbi:MAG: hypothetical protein WA765_20030 [Candidatus Acidiferrum sp.]
MWLRLLALSLLLSHRLPARAAGEPAATPQNVTYCQLAADPSAFSGKRIRLRAIYSYMFEVSRLKSPTCCPGPDTLIWVDFDEELGANSRKLFHQFPEGMGVVLAVLVGKIETGKVYGPFGERVRLVVDQIERVEEKAKPGKGQNPSWVPQNCKSSGNSSAQAER